MEKIIIDYYDLFKTFFTVVLAAIGWVIANYFSSKRDKELKKREIITDHLIKSYQILTNDISHRPSSITNDKKLEDLISDIQLFGSIEQVEMVKMLTDVIITGTGMFDVDDLINSLRTDLRKELGLSPIEGNVRWLRKNKDS